MAEQYDENCVQAQTGKQKNTNTDLTSIRTRAIIPSDQPTVNLDNGMCALPPVQANREFKTASGCHVSLIFKERHDPGIRQEIARLLLTAFEQRKEC